MDLEYGYVSTFKYSAGLYNFRNIIKAIDHENIYEKAINNQLFFERLLNC